MPTTKARPPCRHCASPLPPKAGNRRYCDACDGLRARCGLCRKHFVAKSDGVRYCEVCVLLPPLPLETKAAKPGRLTAEMESVMQKRAAAGLPLCEGMSLRRWLWKHGQ